MAENRKKVLLMGKSGSGKTSMRSIIFANYLARETQRLNPTLDVQHNSVRFLGSLMLNLWDCGGQDAFYESYFNSQREATFRNVAVRGQRQRDSHLIDTCVPFSPVCQVLIYVFDVASAEVDRDLEYYASTIEALVQYSPDAHVFGLLHKMDLVPEAERGRVFEERSGTGGVVALIDVGGHPRIFFAVPLAASIIARSAGLPVSLFRTSIWVRAYFTRSTSSTRYHCRILTVPS